MKDRRTRPFDINTEKFETIVGTLKLKGNNTHDFNEPNDPTYGIWKNFSLEDFSIYWGLPNRYDSKYVYLQQIDFGDLDPSPAQDVFPQRTNMHEAIVDNGTEKNLRLNRHYKVYSTIAASLSTMFGYMLYLSI